MVSDKNWHSYNNKRALVFWVISNLSPHLYAITEETRSRKDLKEIYPEYYNVAENWNKKKCYIPLEHQWYENYLLYIMSLGHQWHGL